jgi:MSHA biogenesis protein MshP
MNRPYTRRSARGLGVITVLVVLVVLAGLAAGIVRLSSTVAATQSADLLGTRAWLAARAGTDWGLYQAFKGSWASCNGATQTLDLRSDTGFAVTVTCNSQSYVDGQTSTGSDNAVRVFTLEAVACNRSACPDDTAATTPGYVERRRVVQATTP